MVFFMGRFLRVGLGMEERRKGETMENETKQGVTGKSTSR